MKTARPRRRKIQEKPADRQAHASRSRQLAILGGIARAITSSLELKEVLAIIFRETKKLVGFDRASVDLVDDSGKINIVYFLEPLASDTVAEGQVFPMPGTGIEWVIKNRKPLIRRSYGRGRRFREDEYILQTGVKSGIVTPLTYRDRVIGTLNLGSREENAYSPQDVKILGHICDSIAVALENARLYRELRTYARKLEERVNERTAELRRSLANLEATQLKLVQTERLAAASKLVAGVAHAVKNPLSSILFSAAVIEKSLDPGMSRDQAEKYCRDSVAIITTEIRRLISLVDRLITFGRPVASHLEKSDLNAVIAGVSKSLLAELLQRKVRLSCSLAADLPALDLDRDEFHHAVLNLFRNSLDAVKPGGRIQVTTSRKGERIILEFEDNGCGIDPAIQKNIFDIFFTTKSDGSGIGLSQVHRAVETHHGSISVQSEPGKGAKFTIELPGKG
jgi:signal transduction histidine kinase